MRILQIRFKNLNSLAGEWAIDLTHPAFLSDGIFVITGPTRCFPIQYQLYIWHL